MPISFSELWEKAEELGTSSPLGHSEILLNIRRDLDEYAKLNNVPSKEIQSILKTKKLGEIIFALTRLSKLDGINSYAGLQIEVGLIENLQTNK